MTAFAFLLSCLLCFSAMGDVWLHWEQEHTAVEWFCLVLDMATKVLSAIVIIILV